MHRFCRGNLQQILTFGFLVTTAGAALAAEKCICTQAGLDAYVTTWGLSGQLIPAGTDPQRPWLLDLDKAVASEQQEVRLQASILSTEGHSHKTRDVLLEMGSTGRVEVTLNGSVVLSGDGARPLKPDRYQAEVRLNGGFNPMSLRLTRPGQGPWQISVRFRGPGGAHAGSIRPYLRVQSEIRQCEPVAEEQFGKIKATPIFDGKSFQGWEGNMNAFRIEDGAIVAGSLEQAVPPRNEYLYTKKEYGDFELKLTAKLIGPNSGIYFRCHRDTNSSEAHGYQMDMGNGVWGLMYDERKTRIIGLQAIALPAEFNPAGWNRYRIRCVGRRIQFWLNGRTTVDYTEADNNIPVEGRIGLQLHGHGARRLESWFRDITVKELPRGTVRVRPRK